MDVTVGQALEAIRLTLEASGDNLARNAVRRRLSQLMAVVLANPSIANQAVSLPKRVEPSREFFESLKEPSEPEVVEEVVQAAPPSEEEAPTPDEEPEEAPLPQRKQRPKRRESDGHPSRESDF